MSTRDLGITTRALLVAIFEIDNQFDSGTPQTISNILSRWGLEDYEKIGDNYRLETQQYIARVKELSALVFHQFNSLVLKALYNDVQDTLKADGKLTPLQTEIVTILYELWQDKLNHNISKFIPADLETVYEPQNGLMALGYLFWIAVICDGEVHETELQALRRNINAWQSENARLIIGAINTLNISDLRIFESFAYRELPGNIKESVINIANYLKTTEYSGARKIMLHQFTAIIKADAKIHPNELWLRNTLKEVWSDL